MITDGQFWTPRPISPAWGQARSIEIPAPAEGAEIKFTIPGQYYWMIQRLELVLALGTGEKETSGDLRFLTAQGHIKARVAFGVTVKATESIPISFESHWYTAGVKTAGYVQNPLPLRMLHPGDEIVTSTATLEAKDTYTGIVAWVEQFEPYPDHPLVEIEKIANKLIRIEEALGLVTDQ